MPKPYKVSCQNFYDPLPICLLDTDLLPCHLRSPFVFIQAVNLYSLALVAPFCTHSYITLADLSYFAKQVLWTEQERQTFVPEWPNMDRCRVKMLGNRWRYTMCWSAWKRPPGSIMQEAASMRAFACLGGGLAAIGMTVLDGVGKMLSRA